MEWLVGKRDACQPNPELERRGLRSWVRSLFELKPGSALVASLLVCFLMGFAGVALFVPQRLPVSTLTLRPCRFCSPLPPWPFSPPL